MKISQAVTLLAINASGEKVVLDRTRQYDQVNMTINPTKRLNRLFKHAANLLQNDFSDWARKDSILFNLNKLNIKMLSAYIRCGGGSNGTDNDEDERSKGE